jgi:hypothetical protein
MARRKRRVKQIGTDSIRDRLAALGFATYSEYLASPHWAEIRLAHRHELRCRACKATGVRLSLHHRTYARLGAERLDDVVKFCDGCHARVHEYGGGHLTHITDHVIRTRGAPLASYKTASPTTGPTGGDRPPWE